MSEQAGWGRFKKYFFHDEELGFSLDISRMGFDDARQDPVSYTHLTLPTILLL